MSHCPSCGRYIGPRQACPHCGARPTGRTPIRTVKIVAILLSTVGLGILWFAATRAEAPRIRIGQAGARMNMAYVRLQGHCTRAPSYDPEGGYLSFWIADDTGEMYVSAYRAETRQIVAEDRVPALGDLVEVAGTLRVREDFLSLTVNVPEQLHVTRPEPVDRDIGSIGSEDQYLRVRVRGRVRSVYEPYPGLTLIAIRDATGSIPVAVSDDLVALSTISPTAQLSAHGAALQTGQSVEVVAAVSLYRDAPQLVPASVADIVPLDQAVPLAAEKRVEELTTAGVGQLAIVRGTVTAAAPFSSGVKLTLDDATGAVVVLLWQSVYDALSDPAALDVGAQIQVQGEISEYRGTLELIPELAADVRVLAPAPPPAETAVSALTAADVGRVVTLRGTLGPPEPFSAGVKFPLDDGTGQIVLLLWSNVCEHAPQELGAGARVIVTGEVGEYRGTLELIPRHAGEIRVTGQGQPPTPAPTVWPPIEVEARAVGDVTSADVGAVLLLTGTLGEPQPFSQGIKFPLDDATGTIILLLWQEVYDAIPDADRLVAGARVEVVGCIEEYGGDLEIVTEADGVRVVE